MANVLNRTSKKYFKSVNTPDYPSADWIINPDLSAVEGWDSKYWSITGDSVTLMIQADRDEVDASELAAKIADEKSGAVALLTGQGDPVTYRALLGIMTVNQLEVRAAKDAIRGVGQPRPNATLEELTIEAIGVINNG